MHDMVGGPRIIAALCRIRRQGPCQLLYSELLELGVTVVCACGSNAFIVILEQNRYRLLSFGTPITI